jgi:uncharacterized membrane protein YoaK (UPF0700 family)
LLEPTIVSKQDRYPSSMKSNTPRGIGEHSMNKTSQRRVNVGLISGLLSFVAGYADTTTFICANRLFSAHVTGNFVVFVFSVVTNAHLSVWMNLLSFPFFVAAVAASSWVVNHSKYPGNVLRIEALLLLIAGVAAAILRLAGMDTSLAIFPLAMTIVVAMGLQNGFGKLYPSTTYSATTIMTGNVTQITLDFMHHIKRRVRSVELSDSLKRQGLIIGFFFIGCLSGGVLAHFTGLPAIILPGMIMLYFWQMRKKLIWLDP